MCPHENTAPARTCPTGGTRAGRCSRPTRSARRTLGLWQARSLRAVGKVRSAQALRSVLAVLPAYGCAYGGCGRLCAALAYWCSLSDARVSPRALPARRPRSFSAFPFAVMSAPSVTSVSSLVASASLLGVSGSRAPASGCRRAVQWALAQRAAGARVVTGCASGVDALGRSVSSAVVLRASAFGSGPGACAARSVAVVRHVAGGAGALWLSAPGRACPVGLAPASSPSACFTGLGSGSWASLALAVGLGTRALVWLPSGVAAPSGWPLALICQGRAGAWWASSVAPQGALFA